MQDKPLVSVLMTVYNREKYIEAAIESVLSSTYDHFELIIVDDASRDQSVNIAKTFAAKDPRIQVHTNEKNLGDYNNRNKAASLAKGTYIKYLDSDDIIYPWGLEVMVRCMEQYPQAGLGLMSYGMPGSVYYPLLLNPAESYHTFLIKNALIVTGPSGAIFRRDAFEQVNGFSGKPYVGDMEMWLKMAAIFPVVAMPGDLVWWRQHEGQQYLEGITNRFYETNRFHIYKDALTARGCPLPEPYRSAALRNLKNVHARNVLKFIVKGKVGRGVQLYKNYNLSPIDILKCFRFNKYPAYTG